MTVFVTPGPTLQEGVKQRAAPGLRRTSPGIECRRPVQPRGPLCFLPSDLLLLGTVSLMSSFEFPFAVNSH